MKFLRNRWVRGVVGGLLLTTIGASSALANFNKKDIDDKFVNRNSSQQVQSQNVFKAELRLVTEAGARGDTVFFVYNPKYEKTLFTNYTAKYSPKVALHYTPNENIYSKEGMKEMGFYSSLSNAPNNHRVAVLTKQDNYYVFTNLLDIGNSGEVSVVEVNGFNNDIYTMYAKSKINFEFEKMSQRVLDELDKDIKKRVKGLDKKYNLSQFDKFKNADGYAGFMSKLKTKLDKWGPSQSGASFKKSSSMLKIGGLDIDKEIFDEKVLKDYENVRLLQIKKHFGIFVQGHPDFRNSPDYKSFVNFFDGVKFDKSFLGKDKYGQSIDEFNKLCRDFLKVLNSQSLKLSYFDEFIDFFNGTQLILTDDFRVLSTYRINYSVNDTIQDIQRLCLKNYFNMPGDDNKKKYEKKVLKRVVKLTNNTRDKCTIFGSLDDIRQETSKFSGAFDEEDYLLLQLLIKKAKVIN